MRLLARASHGRAGLVKVGTFSTFLITRRGLLVVAGGDVSPWEHGSIGGVGHFQTRMLVDANDRMVEVATIRRRVAGGSAWPWKAQVGFVTIGRCRDTATESSHIN